MPVGNAQFIKELDPNNPIGSVDQVSILDDSDREIKRAIVNSFPNINKQVVFSSDELNNLRTNFVYTSGQFTLNSNVLKGVKAIEDDTAVQPRLYNDGRYLNISKNLSDLTDPNAALGALSTNINTGSIGVTRFKAMIADLMYPVGSLYFQTNTDENPAVTFGVGSWVKYGAGRCLVGTGDLNDGSGNRNFSLNATGGNFVHQLSVAEMPSHNHTFDYLAIQGPGPDTKHDFEIAQHGRTTYSTSYVGGNQPHNNMQPWIGVNVWKRIN